MSQVFAEPGRLLLLLMIVGMAGWLVWRGRRRAVEWRSLGLMGVPPATGAWPWWFAAVFLILALAAPRWGRVPGSELPPGHDVVLLVDVSRSMGAEDASPDRLGLARVAARSLVAQLGREPGDRSALVAFAGRAVARCPLTDNLDAVLDSLRDLQPGMIEPGGTDLGAGLTTALDAFDAVEHAEGRSIVVFSDGEDHADAWSPVVGRLVEAKVVVHVVAVGDPDKSYPVPPLGPAPPTGSSSTPAMTQRTDAALTQLAHATGGAVVPLGVESGDLGALYRDRIEPTTRTFRPAPRFAERAERFGVCLSIALTAGLVGTWPSPRRFRSGRSRFGFGFGSGGGRSWGRLAVVVGLAVALVLASLGANPTSPRLKADAATSRGIEANRAGRLAEALVAFEEATAAQPGNPVGPFDAGSVLFAMGRFPEAEAHYGEARRLTDRRTWTIKIDYALGNSLAMLGDFAEAVRAYDVCLAATGSTPDLVAVQRDATINREFALSRIKPPLDDPRDGADEGNRAPDDSKSPPTNRKRPASGSDRDRSARSPGAPDDEANPANDPGASGTRGPGGAGGGGAAPPEADSPAGRLDAALRRIRAARDKRPSDPPPSPPPSTGSRGVGKDW